MYRNLVTSLLDHERVETTDAKAKGVRSLAERMITLGKRGDLHARRRALRVIRSRDVTAKVFDELAERYRDRPGGYTRIVKLGNRVGDAAPVSIIELLPDEAPAPEKGAKKASKKKTAKKAPAAEEKPAKKKATKKKAETSKKTTKKKTTAKKTSSKKKTTKKK